MLSPTSHVDTFSRDHLPEEALWPELRENALGVKYPDRMNCAAVLLDEVVWVRGRDRRCLVTPTDVWSYGNLLDRANQIANVLVDDYGILPGNRVLLRGPNNPWLVASWLGVVKAGGVVVTTMPLLRSAEIAALVEITQPALVLCDHRFSAELEEVRGVTTLTLGGGSPDDIIELTRRKSAEFHNVETAADDVVMLAPTSGTTGIPKVTMHFHRDVLACADTFSRQVLKPEAADLFVATPPLAFTFGLGALVFFPLRAGAASLLLEQPTTAQLCRAIKDHQATILFTAPTAYRSLLREDGIDELKSLRRCVSAGEHLPKDLWQSFHDRTGVRIINGIGATEMLHIFIAADDETPPGSTGKAVPGYVAEVQDSEGRPLPDGEPGFLAVKGPTGCRYLSNQRQSQYVRSGWNITGDTYIRDADGNFWYQSRSDDMIISSGYNIAAIDVEEAVNKHPDVAECAVVGLPNEDRGMVVHAAIVLNAGCVGDDGKVRDIQDYVKKCIAPYKYPRSISFVERLPKTETGKIQRFQLRPSD